MQQANRAIALQRLRAKLLVVLEEQRAAELAEIRGDAVKAEWGQQVRRRQGLQATAAGGSAAGAPAWAGGAAGVCACRRDAVVQGAALLTSCSAC
jgi:hypothetical protein